MAFCANCGAALAAGSGFCGACGKPVGTANQATPASTAAPAAIAIGGNTGLSSNVAGALAYILGLITGILFLVLEPYKNDRFVRFHAMQSVLFSVACIAFAIIWGILTGILLSISGYLWLVTLPIRMLFSLGLFVLWLYVMYQAYNQHEYHIPIIGAIAAKQLG
jgi:uncharacterized membrane protein